MKIILSRKGFDDSNGGQPSPILPDGTMLSIPIPDNDSDTIITYDDLCFEGKSYDELLRNLPRKKRPDYSKIKCHLDPDIRPNVRKKRIENWKPAFGQTETSQGYLHNAGVTVGDLFLFFGWFYKTEFNNHGCLRYTCGYKDGLDFYDHSDLHIIFGYMQIGKILNDPEEISKYFWHPHSSKYHLKSKNNTLYLPSDHLTLAPEKPGFGTLKYDISRVLTLEGESRGIWKAYDFLMPDKIIGQTRKNSAKGKGLYYAGIWQELVFEGTDEIINWILKNIL